MGQKTFLKLTGLLTNLFLCSSYSNLTLVAYYISALMKIIIYVLVFEELSSSLKCIIIFWNIFSLMELIYKRSCRSLKRPKPIEEQDSQAMVDLSLNSNHHHKSHKRTVTNGMKSWWTSGCPIICWYCFTFL